MALVLGLCKPYNRATLYGSDARFRSTFRFRNRGEGRASYEGTKTMPEQGITKGGPMWEGPHIGPVRTGPKRGCETNIGAQAPSTLGGPYRPVIGAHKERSREKTNSSFFPIGPIKVPLLSWTYRALYKAPLPYRGHYRAFFRGSLIAGLLRSQVCYSYCWAIIRCFAIGSLHSGTLGPEQGPIGLLIRALNYRSNASLYWAI